jgi:predicted N-acetyltransferase YhbS
LNGILIEQIDCTDTKYEAVWQIRENVLRVPLGLSLKNEDLSRDKSNSIFVAMLNEQVVGCVFLQPKTEAIVQLRAMAVAFEHQKAGIGKMLVLAAENYARRTMFRKIVLNARKVAVGFYSKLGYQLSDGVEFIEVTIPHYRMEKLLNL